MEEPPPPTNNSDYAVPPITPPQPFPASCHDVKNAMKLQLRVYDASLQTTVVSPMGVIIPMYYQSTNSSKKRQRQPTNKPNKDMEESSSSSSEEEDDSLSSDDDHEDDSSSSLDEGNEEEEETTQQQQEQQKKFKPNEQRQAYMLMKRLQKAMVVGHDRHYGDVYCARVLIPLQESILERNVEWQLTNEMVAIKEIYLSRIHQEQFQLMESLKNEVKAMRYIEQYHYRSNPRNNKHGNCPNAIHPGRLQHVSVPIDVLISSDDGGGGGTTPACAAGVPKYLWFVMPFFGTNADLTYRISNATHSNQPMPEQEARDIFISILKSLNEYQGSYCNCHQSQRSVANTKCSEATTPPSPSPLLSSLELSHRDLSMENFMLLSFSSPELQHKPEAASSSASADADVQMSEGRPPQQQESSNHPHIVAIDFSTNIRVPFRREKTLIEEQQTQQQQQQNGFHHQRCTCKQRLLLPFQGTVGKLKYMAPELLYQRVYDGYAVDIWSCAIILFRMVIGCFPFEQPLRVIPEVRALTSGDERWFSLAVDYLLMQQQRQRQQQQQSSQRQRPPPSREVLDLLRQMLTFDPQQRLCLQQIWNHPWITGTILPIVEETHLP